MTDGSEWIARREASSLARLKQFLAIPSVSTRSEHRDDVARCAAWLAAELRRMGFKAECHLTPGHPIMVAEWRGAPAGAPSVLLYGHYDVQPPEPLELWDSPPFVATERADRIYARGAADDKGQLWIHLMALGAWLEARGSLPVNVVLLIEGEEEVGSPSLPGFLAAHQARLTCDHVVISDSVMFAPGIPSILSSMRGIAYFELTARSAPTDLHSGQYGGVVGNAAGGLARALASLQHADGRVAVVGFYDDVRDVPPERRGRLASLPFDERRFASEVGVGLLVGEDGFAPLERLWYRPSCDVNGIWGGYTGEGSKTVIPGTAQAKVSFRLVPDQTSVGVERQLREHLAALSIPGVTFDLRQLHGAPPWSAPLDSAGVEAARRALATAFEHEAIITGAGGTIPIVSELERHFGNRMLLIGFGLPGENAHGPNEWISLDNIRRGARAMFSLYEELGSSTSGALAGRAKHSPGR
jgi:acetylornithine deacetylase/succinyl-diaminopimelate desuccinylase-like protein